MEDVRKHMDIRSRILSIYNKKESEFETKAQWDDYQETIEDMIYRLEFNIDVAEVEQQLQDYIRFQASKVEVTAHTPGTTTGDGGYVPSGASGPVLPVLLTSVTTEADGRLKPIKQQLTREEAVAAAAAGGWDPGIALRRTIQDTFTTIFVF